MLVLKPRLFIGSSAEALNPAFAIQEGLDRDAEVTVWPQNVFEPTVGNLENLENVLSNFDFAAFVLTPDDVAKMKNVQHPIVRDNVIFECGLFIGRLGRRNVFLIKPRGVDDLHLPSDLAGVTALDYEHQRSDDNLVAALGQACSRMRSKIRQWTPKSTTGMEVNPHYDRDLELLDGNFQRSKVISRETIFITTGTGPVSELLDRPAAALLRDKIDVLGKSKLHRRSIIITDALWLSDSSLALNPAISIGGPPANKATNAVLTVFGNAARWENKGGLFGAFCWREKTPLVALWGASALQTRKAVEHYLIHGLQEFLNLCWK